MRRSMVWCLIGFIVVAIASLAVTIGVGNKPLLGLDLKGGVSVVLKPQGTVDDSTLSQAVSIIQNRVDGLGVANSSVQRQGKDVVVELPGIKNSQNALKTLGTTATLYFRPVYCQIPAYQPAKPAAKAPATTPSSTPATTPKSLGRPGAPADAHLTSAIRPLGAGTPTPTPSPAASGTTSTGGTTTSGGTATSTPQSTTAAPSQQTCQASNAASIPSTAPTGDTKGQSVIVNTSPTSGLTGRYVLGPADLTGKGVSSASVATDQTTGAYEVDLTFNSGGAKDFNKMAAVRNKFYDPNSKTSEPYTSLEGIELDGNLESAPTIQTSNFGNNAQISGSFTNKQASALALELKYGSLPVRFTPQSVQTVSASIGSDSLRAGLLAGLGGIILVMIYMILYYRALGLVVLVGLGLGGALLYSIITELSQSSSLALTLSGVTGIIVSVGITVDSYVVYFERLKDEVRSGRSIRQSTEAAFARAFRTVLTADLVSFMAAAILYLLTVGDVKGFAFTLGLSTILDVFTAYFFIRPAVVAVGRRRTFTENRILGVARGLAVDTDREPVGSGSSR